MDRRDSAYVDRWWDEILDSKARIMYGGWIDVQFVVCPVCDGKGKYVNPDIDRNGISAEEFDEEPDFRAEYVRGTYDMVCKLCNGERVVPEPVNEDDRIAVNDEIEERHQQLEEEMQERRMGC